MFKDIITFLKDTKNFLRGFSGEVMGNEKLPTKNLICAGLTNGTSAALASLFSTVGVASTATVVTVSAGIGLVAGAFGAGAVDIGHRVYNEYRQSDTFFKPITGSEFLLNLVNVPGAFLVAAGTALAQAIACIGYLIKYAYCHFYYDSDDNNYAKIDTTNLDKTCHAGREACLNLAGILFFPLLNLVDLVVGVSRKGPQPEKTPTLAH